MKLRDQSPVPKSSRSPQLYVCVKSYDSSLADQLYRQCDLLGGWISVAPLGLELYVREDVAYILYLIDPTLERLADKDHID
jgi:hypothetical protein